MFEYLFLLDYLIRVGCGSYYWSNRKDEYKRYAAIDANSILHERDYALSGAFDGREWNYRTDSRTIIASGPQNGEDSEDNDGLIILLNSSSGIHSLLLEIDIRPASRIDRYSIFME